MLPGTATASSPIHPQGSGPGVVRHLRQVMLWPLRLIPANVADDSERRRAPWQLLRELGDATSSQPAGVSPRRYRRKPRRNTQPASAA
jgi:hypothetical protein